MKVLELPLTILDQLKDDFQKHGIIKIPAVLEPSVFKLLQSGFEQPFEKRLILDENSSEFTLNNLLLKTKIHFLFNTPEFLSLMSVLIGVKVISSKQRLYYTDPTCVSLPWHDDSYEQDGRVASLRFELSIESYEGGEFSFKGPSGSQTFAQLQLGEALLFKIEHEKCFHQVHLLKKGNRRSLIVFLCQ